MSKVKLTTLYIRDNDGQESSVNISESQVGLSNAVSGIQNRVSLLESKLKNSTGKQTLSHSIGEVFKSKIPLDVFGYHLLDGSYISEYSDYTDFVKFIQSIYENSEDETRYKIIKNFKEYSADVKTQTNKAESSVDSDGIYHGRVSQNPLLLDGEYDKFKYNDTFELNFKFTTNNSFSVRQCLVDSIDSGSSPMHCCYIDIGTDGFLRTSFRETKTSSSWFIKDFKGNFKLDFNTTYNFNIVFDGSSYQGWLTAEGQERRNYFNVSSTVHAGSQGGLFSEFSGYTWGKNDPWLGTIDLKECYFIADGTETWRAFEKKEYISKKGFITDEEYNDCLELSGQCNGIVYDHINRRVRLPTLKCRDLVEYKKPTDDDYRWFNLYSDGWIEQGSKIKLTPEEITKDCEIIKFIVPFEDENYNVIFSESMNASSGIDTSHNNPYIREKFKDQIMVDLKSTSVNHDHYWYAYGYTERANNQSYYYYICIANGVDHLVIDKNTSSQLNIPFTLLEEKISYIKLNNSSWLLSEGQFNSGDVYKTVYDYLLNSQNSLDSDISVKDINSEYNDYDFVIDTVNRKFRLPKKSKQVYSQVDFLNSVKQSATDNARFIVEKKDPTDQDSSWYILYNDGWCEQGANNLTVPGNSANFLVNLVRPYRSGRDYNLTIRISDENGAEDQASEWGCGRKTSSSFEIGINGGYGTTQNFDWSAKGYTDQTTESTLEIGEYQSPLHLYYYVGETNINYSLVDVGHLTEEVTSARSELNYYSKLLKEIDKKSDQYSYDLALKNNTKALLDVDYSTLYSEHMNKLFAMPDPDNTGTIIKLRTNVTKENVLVHWYDDYFGYGNIVVSSDHNWAKSHGAGSYSPMTLIDEFGRTLYLMAITYAHDYIESNYGSNIHYLGNCFQANLTNRNVDGNYTFDLYFTYDKSKANFGSVVTLNEDQIPSYDVKGKMYCDIAQFDGRLTTGVHIYQHASYDGRAISGDGWQNSDDVSYYTSYTNATVRSWVEIPGFTRSLGAVQNLFNTISTGAWAYALNNVTLTFLNTRIKKCSFGVVRDIDMRSSCNQSGYYNHFAGGYFMPQVSNYDFSIETKYGVVSKHYDQTQFTDNQNFKVELDLSEATNKARNMDSRVATYNELTDAKNTLNTRIDDSITEVNNTINTKYNDLSTQIQTVQTNLDNSENALQNQITNNKTDVENKYNELKDLYSKTTKVKVISEEIEEQLELGTEKYDEDTLYLVDPSYDYEKEIYDAKQAVLQGQLKDALGTEDF